MSVLGKILKSGINFSGEVLKFRKKTPTQQQRKTLVKLLKKACFTVIGERYGFSEVLKDALFRDDNQFYEKYKNQIPIYDYETLFTEFWHRAKAGEKNITWPGKVQYFALSSGTSGGPSKYIPVTKDMVKAMQRTSIRQIIALSEFNLTPQLFEKGYLMLGGSTALKYSNGYFEGDLSGINAAKMPFWFVNFYKPGKEIARIRDWEEKLQAIVEQADKWDIGYLAGVPAWIQIVLERIIKHHNLSNIHQLWPNLEIYAWGGVAFEPYKAGFEKLLGKPISYLETYLASEGFLAVQTRPEAKGIELVLNQGIFFEFVPFNEKNFEPDGEVLPNAETLMIDQVQENTEYALLISTCAGAWRYLIGDTVKFTDVARAEIVITGRTKHYLSLCGEHLSVANMNAAIDQVSHELGISVPEFCVCGIPDGNLFAHHWYIACDDKIEPESLKNLIDEKLKDLNDDYAVERQHALKALILNIVPHQKVIDWMASKGKLGGQSKFPRVMKQALFNEWKNFADA